MAVLSVPRTRPTFGTLRPTTAHPKFPPNRANPLNVIIYARPPFAGAVPLGYGNSNGYTTQRRRQKAADPPHRDRRGPGSGNCRHHRGGAPVEAGGALGGSVRRMAGRGEARP